MKARFALFRPTARIGWVTIGAILVGIGVFGAAWAAAQKEDAAASKNRKSTYAALAEAPEKAREKEIPLQAMLRRWLREESSLNNTVSSATEETRQGRSMGRVCCGKKCSRQRLGCCSGF